MKTSSTSTANVKVTYDSKNNTCMLLSPSGKAIIFTPIYLLTVVSNDTLNFFAACENAAQWSKYGTDIQDFSIELPVNIMQDCLKLADYKTIDLSI